MFERIILSAALSINSLAPPTPVNPLHLDLSGVFVPGRKCASVELFTSVNPDSWNPKTDLVVGSLNENGQTIIPPTVWIDRQFDNAPGTTNTYFPANDKPTKVEVTVRLVRNGRTISSVKESISTKCSFYVNT